MCEYKKQQTGQETSESKPGLAVLEIGPHGELCTLLPGAVIHYTNEDRPGRASMSFHVLCLYGTWTVGGKFHPQGERKFKQHTMAQDLGCVQGMQELAGPYLNGG